jgi:hypothetical protein
VEILARFTNSGTYCRSFESKNTNTGISWKFGVILFSY